MFFVTKSHSFRTHEVDMFIWRIPANPTEPIVISPYPSCILTQSASEVVGAAFGKWIVFSGGMYEFCWVVLH